MIFSPLTGTHMAVTALVVLAVAALAVRAACARQAAVGHCRHWGHAGLPLPGGRRTPPAARFSARCCRDPAPAASSCTAAMGAWGEPDTPEMLFGATKSVISVVAGIACDRGLLEVGARVVDTVELDALNDPAGRQIRWRHLLQQTSGWNGQMWG